MDEAKKETTTLIDETKSTPTDVRYQPQAFTREGKSD
jgi:hypothetical protein